MKHYLAAWFVILLLIQNQWSLSSSPSATWIRPARPLCGNICLIACFFKQTAIKTEFKRKEKIIFEGRGSAMGQKKCEFKKHCKVESKSSLKCFRQPLQGDLNTNSTTKYMSSLAE